MDTTGFLAEVFMSVFCSYCASYSLYTCHRGLATVGGDCYYSNVFVFLFFYFVITFLERDYVSDHFLSFFCRVVYYRTLINHFFFLLLLSENAGMSFMSYKVCFTLFRHNDSHLNVTPLFVRGAFKIVKSPVVNDCNDDYCCSHCRSPTHRTECS